MSPVKEALRETIEQLSDEDAGRLLEMARRLHERESLRGCVESGQGDPIGDQQRARL